MKLPLLTLNSISVHMFCTSNPLSTNHIPCSESYMPSLPICLICNAPLSCTFVESDVLICCLASLQNPMSCTFDLQLWFAPWLLCLVLSFALHFFVHHFLHVCVIAHWFPLSHTCSHYTSRTSIASLPCSWNPFILHLELVCLPYVLHHQILCLSHALHLCLASLIFFIACSVKFKCVPLYLASLSFTFVLLFQQLFCAFGLHVLNLHSVCNVFDDYLVVILFLNLVLHLFLYLWMLSSNAYAIVIMVFV